jgi:hypothetical protein
MFRPQYAATDLQRLAVEGFGLRTFALPSVDTG